MSDAVELYETDFIRWAEGQAEVLRAARATGANLPLDWDNLVEEIESLGRSQRTELRSRLSTIVEHLLKLAVSPASDPRTGWKATVRRERDEVEALLDTNRSLRREVAAIIQSDIAKIARRVGEGLADHGEDDPAVMDKLRLVRLDPEDVLGGWFPEQTTNSTPSRMAGNQARNLAGSGARCHPSPMSDAVDLYETDFMRWAEQQAEALRAARAAGANLPLDWDNLAEEIESLARAQRRELRSRLDTIIEHLLKLQFSPASDPRPGWRNTVERERGEIEALLADNRSLRSEVASLIGAESGRVAKRVATLLIGCGELDAALASRLRTTAFSENEVLADRFPDPPAAR